ncbi:MAG: dTDP-4-dehydrorhamnose 3,5-epimerase family protein [Magnetococcales bacterium]|nr:dTDP-4-dehydrorhamnose 3,5-epimerase family protein [Magnetococcales bacterium]
MKQSIESTDPYRIVSGEQLQGMEIRPLTMHRDGRGAFTEVYRDIWNLPLADPVQWSVVHSRPGVLRGMHLHWHHDEYYLLLQGRSLVGLYDARPASSTADASVLIELDGRQPSVVSFPTGVLHGWYSIEETLHLQGVSENYDDYHPEDNLGVHWSDPALNIPWPDPNPTVAERADSFPMLAQLRAHMFR